MSEHPEQQRPPRRVRDRRPSSRRLPCGHRAGYVDAPKAFDKTFRLGDRCEYDSYNLKYTGTIVSIGAKTIVVDDDGNRRRLTLYDFTWRNWDFDPVAIGEHNANERLYI